MDVFDLESKATILRLWQHSLVVNPIWRKSSVPPNSPPLGPNQEGFRKGSSFDSGSNTRTREMITRLSCWFYSLTKESEQNSAYHMDEQ